MAERRGRPENPKPPERPAPPSDFDWDWDAAVGGLQAAAFAEHRPKSTPARPGKQLALYRRKKPAKVPAAPLHHHHH